MKIAFAIIAIFCARLLVAAWFYPAHDGDLVWQQVLGNGIIHAHAIPRVLGDKTFTAPGAPWLPQEWAFSVAVAYADATAHFALLAALSTFAAIAAMFLTAWRAYRRGAATAGIALATFCTGFSMMQAFGVRAQVLGWPLLAIVMLMLDSESSWIFCIIPVVALWANLHASAAIAPVLVGAWTLGTLIEDRAWTPRVERNVVLTAGCVLAIFMTPFLWHLPVYAIGLATSSFRASIAEWQPSDFTSPAFLGGVLPLFAACWYFGIAAPRERWRDGALFAVACVMAFDAVRHLPLCAIVVAPMAAQRLNAIFPPRGHLNAILHERFSEAVVFTTSAVAVVVTALTLSHVPAIAGLELPRGAVAALARDPGEHRLYCEDFAWCSLALKEPNLRTFIDGRCDPFPKPVWNAYLDVSRVTPRWRSVLDRYGVDAVLVKRGQPLAQALALRTDWRVFYRDGRYLVFTRTGIRTAQR